MAFKPSDFTDIATLIGQLYEQAEQDVIAMIAKNAEKYMSQSHDQWLKTQMAYIKQNQAMIQKILEAYQAEGAKVLNRLPVRMYLAGVMSADEDLLNRGEITEYDVADITLDDVKGADALKTMGQFGIIHAGAVNALASAYLGSITNAVLQVTRNADDIYKKVTTQATTSALLGTQTRVQATQNALNQYLAHGVGGFRDKAGRNWNLSSYAQMATRTLITNAHNQGKANRYTEFGKDLVIVSQHQRACGLCRPWERKILSLSGKHPDYPAFDKAKGDGLFHPNCGHTFTAYIPGLTITDDYEPTDPQGYIDQQRLRELERHMRKAKEQLAIAVSPADKKKAQDRIDSLSAQIKSHCEATGIPRKRSNEKVMKGQIVKKANDIATGGTGKPTGGAKKKPTTQKPGTPPKAKEEPRTGFSDEDRKNSEAYKRMMQRKEEIKKRQEAEKKRQEASFEFDINKTTADDLPEGLRKEVVERTLAHYQGLSFKGTSPSDTPFIGYTTVDKLFGNKVPQYKTEDITNLANAWQMYITGQHIGTPHKFAHTKKEFDRILGRDSSKIGGFNAGGFEIWYGPLATKQIEDVFKNKKLPTDMSDLHKTIYSISTIVHEQYHSVRFDHDQHGQYQRIDREGTRWYEEGMTQFLTLYSMKNFMKFTGLYDDEDNKKLYDKYEKDYMFQYSVYEKETSTIGIIAYTLSKTMGLSEKQVVTGLMNAKGQAIASTSGMAQMLSNVTGKDEATIQTALNKIVQDGGTKNLSADSYVGIVEALGGGAEIVNTIKLAFDRSKNQMEAYILLRENMK